MKSFRNRFHEKQVFTPDGERKHSGWRLAPIVFAAWVSFGLAHAMAATIPTENEKVVVPAPAVFTSQHEININGHPVSYLARAEATILDNKRGEPAASLFSFSYIRTDIQNEALRPVLFLFNGGPGSSSVWLHMSGLGPKRIAFKKIPNPNTAPPFQLVDSDFSVLDVADLVFIDPIETGFSKLLPAGRPQDYYGFNEDAQSIGEFMRIWITKYHRWNSPKYILGESYGSQRAAALVKALNTGVMTIPLNGIILLGQALDMTSTNPDPGNDMSCELILPSMADTAWYHNKVDKSGYTFDSFLDAARHFASTEYAAALFAGSTLPGPDREKIAQQLAKFTGLKTSVLLSWNLRVTRARFLTALLQDENEVLAGDDGRFVEKLVPGTTNAASVDPFMDQIAPAIKSGFNDYLESGLRITTLDTYKIQAADIDIKNWDWDTGAPGTARFYFNVAPLIAGAMHANPQLRLMIGTGYYDLLTPFFSAEHTVSHSGIPLSRVQINYYESGHMPYIGEANARKLASDLRAFVTARQ